MADQYVDTGVVFLRSQNVQPFRLDLRDVKYIPPDFHRKLRKSALSGGDVVIVRTGYPGTAAVVPRIFPEANCADLVILRPGRRLDPWFLACIFNSSWGKGAVSGSLVGVAQQHFNVSVAKNLRVALPPITIQQRIAGILSAYDDLIENNTRRIAILEEMTRRLFDEWFVHFRFSGHETAKLVDSPLGPLPETWSIKSLAFVCEQPNGIQTGPFGSQLHQSDYTPLGVPVVMPKNLIGLRIVEDGIARIPEELAEQLSRHRMEVGDIVYGRRGDIGRRAFISKRESGWFCGTGCLRLRPNGQKIEPRFLFDALGLRATDGAIKGRAQGATMPNLSSGAMAGVPILYPPRTLQRRYGQIVEENAQLCAILSVANVRLAASRDLLLPRLISGEIDLAAADRLPEAAD
jgi:type I restriction enzyme S subunit